MERDEVIITVYCLVCEHSQVIKRLYSLRRDGFAPALSDEEVITMEICGEYFKLPTAAALTVLFPGIAGNVEACSPTAKFATTRRLLNCSRTLFLTEHFTLQCPEYVEAVGNRRTNHTGNSPD